ncbi:Uncharacterised protein [Pseudomonas aeruginosa]|nr:Uncharacterised protein [Pseudomonas aeruginosa]
MIRRAQDGPAPEESHHALSSFRTSDRPVPQCFRTHAAQRSAAFLCLLPAPGLAGVPGPAGGRPDRRADRGGAVQLPRPHRRSRPEHAQRGVLPRARQRTDLDGGGGAGPAPAVQRPARHAGAPEHQPEHDQPDPLAEPPLRAQAEPRLLPERFRRAHRPAHHADRQLVARFGGAGGGRPLARADLYRQRPGAVRRGRLAPDDPSGAVGVRLRRRPRLLRSPGQAPLGGGLGFALEADGADRRRLHQHHHAESCSPTPARKRTTPAKRSATRPSSRNAPGA